MNAFDKSLRRGNMRRLGDIDLLRGYAATFVALGHFVGECPWDSTSRRIGSTLDLTTGVDLFFVISGFVISLALGPLWNVASNSDAVQMRNIPLRFYQKRFLRLWPALAVWSFFIFAMSFIFFGGTRFPYWTVTTYFLIASLTYLFNFAYAATLASPMGHFWTLAVEWQFYMLFPFVLLFARTDTIRAMLVVGMLAISVFTQVGGAMWWVFRFDGIVIGILLYIVLHRLKVKLPEYAVLKTALGRQIVTGLVLLAMVALPVGIIPGQRFGVVITSLLACILVALAVEDKQYIGTFGLYPFFAWAGSRSYSIYLAHLPILNFVWSLQNTFPHLRGSLFYYVASVTLSGLAAELTFRFVERPSHAASRRISLGLPGGVETRSRPDGDGQALPQQSARLHPPQIGQPAT
jgi:peptidoglycan/LPS O-acetylase OafA/YrhL